MSDIQNKLYMWEGVFWSVDALTTMGPIVKARCPVDKCELNVDEIDYSYLTCPRCGFRIELNKSFYEKREDALKIMQSDYFKDAEVVNIDGEMIKVGKEVVKDSDYWVKAYISKSIKGVKQLMVLIGSKKDKDKTQLFLDIDNEKLSFDQKDKHPKEILAKVIAEFKESKSEIELKEEEKDPKNLEKLGKNLGKH
jgi:DNA-directed RNA polymerase subunit RPC12/RpoP